MKYLTMKIYALPKLVFLLVCLMGISFSTQAQCTLICNDFIHISLPAEGTITFQSNGSEDIFLETTDCPLSRLELSIYASDDDFQNNIPMSDMTFTVADDGKQFPYLIRDTLSGNACWGSFLIEDKINGGGGENCTLACNAEVYVTLWPQDVTTPIELDVSMFLASDDCNENDVSLSLYTGTQEPVTDLTEVLDQDSVILSYVLTHDNGNTCWGVLYVYNQTDTNNCEPLDANAIVWPAETVNTCDTDPSVTGEPSWSENEDWVAVASYADEVIVVTDSTSKIIRTWTVIDWCTNATYDFVQIILTSCATDNCTLVCNAYVNISLPQDGILELSPTGMTDWFLEGYTCPDGTLILSTYATPEDFQNNNPMSDMTFTVADDGKEFNYLIQDTLTGNACWGVFLIEDKTNIDCTPFDVSQITWPADTLATCDIDPSVTGEPEYTLVDSQLVAHAYDDVIFQTVTSTFKVIRTWTVLDWCTNNTYTYTQIILTPCVHPGDTNNDGVANHFDLLNIGLAYTEEGLARSDAGLDWTAQASEDWTSVFNNGRNHKFADSDGDGRVDAADIVAINNNWGLTHGLATPSVDNNPPVGLAIDFYVAPDTLFPNTMVSLPVILGTPNAPAINVYGLAFSVQFDTEKLLISSSELNTSNSWLGMENDDMSVVYKFFPNEGRIDVALTRIDAIEVSGQGQLCALDIIIEDVIFLQQGSGGAEVNSDTYFTIENIRIINNEAETLMVNPLSMPFVLGENTTSIQPLTSTENIKLFPNPTFDKFMIESMETTIDKFEIFNVNGQIIQTISRVESLHIVPTSNWQEGFYFVKIYTDEGVFVEKVLVMD